MAAWLLPPASMIAQSLSRFIHFTAPLGELFSLLHILPGQLLLIQSGTMLQSILNFARLRCPGQSNLEFHRFQTHNTLSSTEMIAALSI